MATSSNAAAALRIPRVVLVLLTLFALCTATTASSPSGDDASASSLSTSTASPPGTVLPSRTICALSGSWATVVPFTIDYYRDTYPNVTWYFRWGAKFFPGAADVLRWWVLDGSMCDVFIGPAWSTAAISMSPLVPDSVLWLDPSSTSSELSDKDLHPTFSRVIPTDEVNAQMATDTLSSFGWTHINILCEDNAYGRSLASSIASAWAAANGTVEISRCVPQQGNETFPAPTQWYDALEAVVAARTRVTYLAMNLKKNLRQALLDVRAYSKVTFILAETSCQSTDGSVSQIPSSICVTSAPVGANTTAISRFQDAFVNRNTAAVEQELRARGATTKNLLDFPINNSLNMYAWFMHDATKHAMSAISAAIAENTKLPISVFARNQSTAGATGQVEFDEKTGNRKNTIAAVYNNNNLVPGVTERPLWQIGTIDKQIFKANATPHTYGNRYLPLSEPPASHPDPPSLLLFGEFVKIVVGVIPTDTANMSWTRGFIGLPPSQRPLPPVASTEVFQIWIYFAAFAGFVFVVILFVAAVWLLRRHRRLRFYPTDPAEPFTCFFVSAKNVVSVTDLHPHGAQRALRFLERIVGDTADRNACVVARRLEGHFLVVSRCSASAVQCVTALQRELHAVDWPSVFGTPDPTSTPLSQSTQATALIPRRSVSQSDTSLLDAPASHSPGRNPLRPSDAALRDNRGGWAAATLGGGGSAVSPRSLSAGGTAVGLAAAIGTAPRATPREGGGRAEGSKEKSSKEGGTDTKDGKRKSESSSDHRGRASVLTLSFTGGGGGGVTAAPALKLHVGIGMWRGVGRIVYDPAATSYGYYGDPVNKAAELTDLASPGQALAVRAVLGSAMATGLPLGCTHEKHSERIFGSGKAAARAAIHTVITDGIPTKEKRKSSATGGVDASDDDSWDDSINGELTKKRSVRTKDSGTFHAEEDDGSPGLGALASALEEAACGMTTRRVAAAVVSIPRLRVLGAPRAGVWSREEHTKACERVFAVIQRTAADHKGSLLSFTDGTAVVVFNAAKPTTCTATRAAGFALHCGQEINTLDLDLNTGFGMSANTWQNQDQDLKAYCGVAVAQSVAGSLGPRDLEVLHGSAVIRARALSTVCSKMDGVVCVTDGSQLQELEQNFMLQFLDVAAWPVGCTAPGAQGYSAAARGRPSLTAAAIARRSSSKVSATAAATESPAVVAVRRLMEQSQPQVSIVGVMATAEPPADDEWMYQLEEGASRNPFGPANTALRRVAASTSEDQLRAAVTTTLLSSRATVVFSDLPSDGAGDDALPVGARRGLLIARGLASGHWAVAAARLSDAFASLTTPVSLALSRSQILSEDEPSPAEPLGEQQVSASVSLEGQQSPLPAHANASPAPVSSSSGGGAAGGSPSSTSPQPQQKQSHHQQQVLQQQQQNLDRYEELVGLPVGLQMQCYRYVRAAELWSAVDTADATNAE